MKVFDVDYRHLATELDIMNSPYNVRLMIIKICDMEYWTINKPTLM